MKTNYKVLLEGNPGEYVQKKSRFIANPRPVDSEEEALRFIEELKKKYWDARHNCYAYVIGENMELQRFSDDGEPGGTAGKPILDVLLGNDIHNALIVVTRYFGGTLLGTGGLIRAYSKASQLGLENSKIVEKISGMILLITTDYNGIGKIQYILGQQGIDIMESEYLSEVKIKAIVPTERLKQVCEELIEATGGKAQLTEGELLFFAHEGKELIVF